jgi:hypothetical protein
MITNGSITVAGNQATGRSQIPTEETKCQFSLIGLIENATLYEVGCVQRRASPTSARPKDSCGIVNELIRTPLTLPSLRCEGSVFLSQNITILMLCDCWRRVCRNTRDLNEDRSLYSAFHAWKLIIAERLIAQASLAISQRLLPSFTVSQLFGGDSEVGRCFILRYIRSGVCG